MSNASTPEERRERRMILLLLAPALIVVGLLLITPLVWMGWQSFRGPEGFTLAHYARFFTDTVYLSSFVQTFRIAFLVTIAAILIGYPIAYVAAKSQGIWPPIILGLVLLPFWTSVLVRAYAWLILLQRRGIVNTALTKAGVIDQPLILVNNEFGTVMATLHILLPFMVLPLYATMKKIPAELEMAGASLGGGGGLVFRSVFLPLSMPGVIAGSVLVFVLTLGFYITPELLGGGRTFLVSMLVSRNIEIYNEWGAASSISVVLLVMVFAIFRLASMIIPFERIMGTK
ncbi:ABC transporter permease [Paracoccus laeviglucosivorans]|uniref:Putative spermidine/putrescine transport system permease protein n=1 Tax=Paracoccus laeviglucosivorans TaxID=1197861 RepID=A0A521E9M0_9RHOB|nr:ABC transporter permease [Paracoccus laeviglucosivorans]SMO80648.1 putative spermidine/putrescine transport system permease protein [Paracoccus laeviglucosivorans]